ncbi:MAG: DUF979 domain-containing protein [Peptoniphilaceae bacterium]|nr:DUF979 domain-containing protein [Peptoniphilaceae bacterium]MDY3738521.1 DUF979 domain-containing protein [Peptoniphilaceae bacterium]
MDAIFSKILEIIYIVIGLQFFYTGYKVLRSDDSNKKITTSIFWFLLSALFIFGSYLPPLLSGVGVVVLGVLNLGNSVINKNKTVENEIEEKEKSKKYGNLIFLPVILMALIALLIANLVEGSSKIALGISAAVSILIALLITKSNPKEVLTQSDRMVQQVGPLGILPQLLASLGAIFTLAGVGDVISNMIGGFIPETNILAGCIAYCLGMVIFTMIMGNAFAAFTVITAGIGVPFVFVQGANPAIASALAMTAGYCGTLMTPMAGNFNMLPAVLLEMKDENGVIKAQLPIALIMIVIHILLMYFLAF